MKKRISIVKGDIINSSCEGIVNAANTSLLGGGGIDGAIHSAAGEQLLEECRTLNGCKVGEAKITAGYKLNAKYVIHTVGPIWAGGHRNEHELLAASYRNTLRLANDSGISSLAIPNISTGAYNFPAEQAANIAISEVRRFIAKYSEPEEIVFVVFTEDNFTLYKKILESE